MTEHKQTEIMVDGYPMLVDEGLEEVIGNFFHWDIETCNSCMDMDGSIWIEFCNFDDWEQFLQLALRNNILIDGKHETLWDFLQRKARVKVVFDEEVIEDPNSAEDVTGTGVLIICIGLYFPKDLLDEFKELFFEVLPPE